MKLKSFFNSRRIKNHQGFMAMDFIFAMVLVLSFTVLLFAMALTLTTIEVTQYLTYSAARTYLAGHVNHQSQKELSQNKFLSLMNSPALSSLYNNNWFELGSKADPTHEGDFTEANPFVGDPYPKADVNLFTGVITKFSAKILDMNILFLGSTSPKGSGTGEDFQVTIGSYMGREVTQSECSDFVNKRWEAIQKIQNANYGQAQSRMYVPIIDNGC